MASPFNIFRKNQKVAMASLVVIAIIAFIIAPALEQVIRGANSVNPAGRMTLVRWQGGSIDAAQAARMQQINGMSQQFLRTLAMQVLKAGGRPRVPGFQGTAEQFDLSLTPNDQLAIIRNKFLAEKAARMGIEFDDAAVDSYLTALCDDRINTREKSLGQMMRETSNGGLSRHELYQFLKDEFAADVLEKLAMTGFSDGSMPMLTPRKNWQLFLKFNQRAKIEAFPVIVQDFLAQVDQKPSDAQLRELYEVGKVRFPSARSAEVGFQKRYTANFEFVSGSLKSFMDVEKAKLTDEQINTAYETRVKEGRYKVPVSPANDSTTPAITTPPTSSAVPPALDAPVVPDASSPNPDSPSPNNEAPKSNSLELGLPTESTKESPAPKDQSNINSEKQVRLVSFQEPAADAAAPSPQTLEQPPAPEEKPVASDPTGSTPTSAAPAMRTQTLDEVKDQLTNELVMDVAREKMSNALTMVQERMRTYQQQLEIYNQSVANGVKSAKEPSLLDLKKLADEYSLEYGKTGMIDIESAQSLPIGKSQAGNSTFANVFVSPQWPKWNVAASNYFDFTSGSFSTFVSWKTDESPAFIPKFEDARADVESAWKLMEARKLALKKADELAAQAKTVEESPWTAILPEEQRGLVITPNTFTYLQSSQVMGRPTMSTVNQLDDVSDPQKSSSVFLEKVFAANPGQTIVAPNERQSTYYVVRVLEKIPGEVELREQFARTPIQMDSRQMSFEDYRPIFLDWYSSVEKDLQVQWMVDESNLNTAE